MKNKLFGSDLANVWNGQKYALVKLGLIESPLTLAQEMSSLDAAAKSRIERFIAKHREELD